MPADSQTTTELRPPQSLEKVAMAHWLMCSTGVRPAWWEPGSTERGGYWCLLGVGRCVWPNEMPKLGYTYLDRAVWQGLGAQPAKPPEPIERQPHCQAIDPTRCDFPDCPCGWR